ncbi:hypothetical protein DAMA08_015050 [Martiniozyma asiatica (nom. inval.)]|nr:hypothetical protein DAMA08_015050 [Martiniozyma asiatica]
MSWNGFKKAVNRAHQQVILKASYKKPEETVDVEFTLKEEAFGRFETLIDELQGELNRFKDNFRDIIETHREILNCMDSFYGSARGELGVVPRDGITAAYLANVENIRQNVVPQLFDPLNTTVFEPIREIGEYNEEIHRLIKKRGRKKFDYDVMKGKLLKMQEEYDHLNYQFTEVSSSEVTRLQLQKSNEKLNKMVTEFDAVESIYLEINERLKSEIEEYITLRFSFLDPSFESFIKIQMKLFTDIHKQLQRGVAIDAQSKEDYITGKLDARLDEILHKMKGLDIHSL